MRLPDLNLGNMDIKLKLGSISLNVLYVKFGYFYHTMPEHSHSQGSYELHYIPTGHGILRAQGQSYHYRSITLLQLAAALGLSPRQTERMVYKQYGMSFQDKKQHARMAAASTLLLTTDHSIYAIAAQIGFTTPEQFSKAFKKYYGVTASHYKKTAKLSLLSKRKPNSTSSCVPIRTGALNGEPLYSVWS